MPSKGQAFVAMPFKEEFTEIYEDVIRPAIENAGLTCLRVDEVPDNKVITDDIEDGIRDSLLLIADVTERNANVLYEVGFARALSVEVIVLTQKSEDVPFDITARRYIRYGTTARQMDELRLRLQRTIETVLPRAILEEERRKILTSPHGRVICHGTKFTVPNSSEFWSSLLRKAEYRFYLIGYTNKSWIHKSEEQSVALGDAIIRIIESGGIVKILSVDDEDIISLHTDFIRDYVVKKVRRFSNTRKQAILSRLEKSERQKFIYAVSNNSNYGAVISDGRFLLLPTMNSPRFRDEALVLELKQGIHSPQFENYIGDIDRMFKSGSRMIKII